MAENLINILQWRGFVFKRDATLKGNEGIKFEKLLFISPAFYKLVEGAENDAEIELLINNAKWKVAILTSKGKQFFQNKK